ncbi:MAG: helix-turn-helix transcriptional regulator [Deltaproteobacteria bacterium]|nr:helix-turn-helix transcriptional regulator [Deltaproteobacteria bacterium]
MKPSLAARPTENKRPRRQSARFGEYVRRLRLTKGWTLDDAAEHMGLDPKYLQKIETGRVNVTLPTALRVLSGLGEPMSAAFEEPAQRPPSRPTLVATRVDDPDVALHVVGNNVARLRLSLGWTQRTLAARVGLGLTTVQQVEAGKQNLTVRSLVLLAATLDVDVATLFLAGPETARRQRRPRVTGNPRPRT